MNNKTKTTVGILFVAAVFAVTGVAVAPLLLQQNVDAQGPAGPCTNPNPNSACSYAPGHGGTPPGQTGDPRTNAPGQLK